MIISSSHSQTHTLQQHTPQKKITREHPKTIKHGLQQTPIISFRAGGGVNSPLLIQASLPPGDGSTSWRWPSYVPWKNTGRSSLHHLGCQLEVVFFWEENSGNNTAWASHSPLQLFWWISWGLIFIRSFFFPLLVVWGKGWLATRKDLDRFFFWIFFGEVYWKMWP